MSPSCCGRQSSSYEDRISVDGLPCGRSPEARTIGNPEEATCCTGSECGCDDSCLDQLARAICADDDGHIHTALSGDNERAASDDFVAPKVLCRCDDTTDTDHTAESCPSNDADKLVHSAADATKQHSCELRKRKGSETKKQLPKEACGEHRSLTRSRYEDTLSAFGCICKAMLARGLHSCCTLRSPIARSLSASLSVGSTKKSSPSEASCARSCCGGESIRSRSRVSVDSCCRDGCCGASIDRRSHSKLSLASCSAGRACAATSMQDVTSLHRTTSPAADSCCSKSCCGQSDIENVIEEKHSIVATRSRLESLNHAVLAVKGMTCTGCENKLISALRAQPTIVNVKTSLVLSRAEFDYTGKTDDIRTLISAIEKHTGFSVERMECDSSTRALELLVDPSAQDRLLSMGYPDGVRQVVKVNRKILRVIYDPHVIGARDVLSSYAAFTPILAPEPQDPALAAGEKHVKTLLARTIGSAILTIPVLIMAWAPLPPHERAYGISSLVLASLVQTVIAGPFYRGALKSLVFSGLIEVELLIVLSTTTAYVYSIVAFAFDMIGRPLDGGSFFETSTLLVTLIMCGQLASAFARHRAIAAISLRSLQQQSATIVLTQWDGRIEEKIIDVRLLHYDDTFRVYPDSVVITDGVVLSGTSSIDESMMTGEALPVEKSVGSDVLAGTTNGAGSLLVKVTRLPGENTISEIAGMVDDARLSRARVQSIVDRICAWFVPVALAISVITFVVWILVGIYVRKQSAGKAAVTALTYAIAVLAVSCPCAIGLAVPMVVLVASGVAARLGIVFKAATTIESARTVTHVVFDKTGTLTMGRLEVVDAYFQNVDAEMKSAILAITTASHHPVARAVSGYLTSSGVASTSRVLNVKEVTGRGIEGILDSKLIRGGSAKWLEAEAHASLEGTLSSGLTSFCVTYEGNLLATFTLSDTLRSETPAVLALLSARGMRVSILSGDHTAAVNRVASSLGIPFERVRAGCLPADKAAYVRELQLQGEKVMFCGDGTNDSVALAQADIGVHMSSDASSAGAGAAASSASDAVLIHPSLHGLLSLVDLSEAVHRRIVLNFSWAAVYNLVAVLFAAGAFVNARISPAYAGLGEIVSVLPVVLVAMQLKWFKAN